MTTCCDEGVLSERALKNLRFLIELELQATRREDGSHAVDTQAVLRRMMDMEEALRQGRRSPAASEAAPLPAQP